MIIVESIPIGTGQHFDWISDNHAGAFKVGVMREARWRALSQIGEHQPSICLGRIRRHLDALAERLVFIWLLEALTSLIEPPAVVTAAQTVTLHPT
jgi:hypothetical protein